MKQPSSLNPPQPPISNMQAEVIGSRKYIKWRGTGVAYELRDGGYSHHNKTLATYARLKTQVLVPLVHNLQRAVNTVLPLAPTQLATTHNHHQIHTTTISHTQQPPATHNHHQPHTTTTSALTTPTQGATGETSSSVLTSRSECRATTKNFSRSATTS